MFASLWIGNEIPPLQKRCIESFIDHGIDYSLYSYNNIKNVPVGVIHKDANTIIDQKEIFIANTILGESHAPFSDIFRYMLLKKEDGLAWVDTDIFCISENIKDLLLKDYVFLDEGYDFFVGSILKAPSKSLFLNSVIDQALLKKQEKIKWNELGSSILNEKILEYDLSEFSIGNDNVLALNNNYSIFFNPNFTGILLNAIKTNNLLAIIFWNSAMKNAGYTISKDTVPKNSFFDILLSDNYRKLI